MPSIFHHGRTRLGGVLTAYGAPRFWLLKHAWEGITCTTPPRCPSPSSSRPLRPALWSRGRGGAVTSPSAPQYPLSGGLEHAHRVFCRARPIQVCEPVAVPVRGLQRLGHKPHQRYQRQVGLWGVAAYMDEAVVEAASALQRHGHQSRLNGKPSRWRHSPVRQRSGSGGRRTIQSCVCQSAAPRRPVDADPSAAQRGNRNGFDGGLSVVDSLGMAA